MKRDRAAVFFCSGKVLDGGKLDDFKFYEAQIWFLGMKQSF